MNPKEQLDKEFGIRVKSIRDHFNMLQKDFALSLDITAPTLSEVENGNNRPSVDLLMGLSRKYEVNLYYILFGADSMFMSPVHEKWGRSSEFAVNLDSVRDFLFYFENSKIVQYRVLALFSDLMNREKESITSDLKKLPKEE